MIFTPTKYADLALDAWYFHRKNEIRSQRGVDIMDTYNANPDSVRAAIDVLAKCAPPTVLVDGLPEERLMVS